MLDFLDATPLKPPLNPFGNDIHNYRGVISNEAKE